MHLLEQQILQWISQQPLMIKSRFNFLNTLLVADESLFSIRLHLLWKKLVYNFRRLWSPVASMRIITVWWAWVDSDSSLCSSLLAEIKLPSPLLVSREQCFLSVNRLYGHFCYCCCCCFCCGCCCCCHCRRRRRRRLNVYCCNRCVCVLSHSKPCLLAT